jgi:hypothetical protein
MWQVKLNNLIGWASDIEKLSTSKKRGKRGIKVLMCFDPDRWMIVILMDYISFPSLYYDLAGLTTLNIGFDSHCFPILS